MAVFMPSFWTSMVKFALPVVFSTRSSRMPGLSSPTSLYSFASFGFASVAGGRTAAVATSSPKLADFPEL